MWFLISGIVLLSGILGMFWLKDQVGWIWLRQACYHELTARLAVVSFAFIVFGTVIAFDDIMTALGIWEETPPAISTLPVTPK